MAGLPFESLPVGTKRSERSRRVRVVALALRLLSSIGFTVLLVEVGLAVGARLEWFPIGIPGYSLAQARNPVFWRDLHPAFGVWHPPNAATRHRKSCYDVVYRSNAHGMRDPERPLHAARPRIVVLGDSITEGFGVTDGQRFTDVLERETGIAHLNFGTAGNFGTIQYWLLYETLARSFSHEAVLIGLLPDNDFLDNDYEFGRVAHADRYRPYLVGTHPHYRLVHEVSSLDRSAFRDDPGWTAAAVRFLGEFTYLYNAYAYYSQLIRAQPDDGAPNEVHRHGRARRPRSGYYDYSASDARLVEYTLEKIRDVAAGRPVVVALLPRESDFHRYNPKAPLPWSEHLVEFARTTDLTVVDLLPGMYQRCRRRSCVLPCDGHWNAQGHEIAAELLRTHLRDLYARWGLPRKSDP